jgi:acetyl-CoA carboxylase biotin carboxyl carrier protein
VEINELEMIIKILKQNDVTEFELNQQGVHIKLARGSAILAPSYSQQVTEIRPAIVNSPSMVSVSANGNSAEHSKADANLIPPNWVKIESPIVGTFYRKPSPDSEVFVKEGDMVKKGDTLCIIEAMKLMNEIEATSSGRIEKICLTEGQVVEYGEVLFLINPN